MVRLQVLYDVTRSLLECDSRQFYPQSVCAVQAFCFLNQLAAFALQFAHHSDYSACNSNWCNQRRGPWNRSM